MIAGREELPALATLWETCFGDSAGFARSFFEALAGEAIPFCNDDRTAMLTALPVSWQGRRAAYLYAVATAPEARMRGLCRALMAEAEETLRAEGFEFALLCPADVGLFAFYERLGYRTCFYASRWTYRAGAPLPVRTVSPAEYAALRARFAPDAVAYGEALLRWQERSGALLAVGELGCAAVEKTPRGCVAAELLSPEPELAAGAICRYLGADRLPVRMPGLAPAGMAKPLTGLPLVPSFLGLPLD